MNTHNLKYALLEDEYLTGRDLQATVSELRPAYMMCAICLTLSPDAHIM